MTFSTPYLSMFVILLLLCLTQDASAHFLEQYIPSFDEFDQETGFFSHVKHLGNSFMFLEINKLLPTIDILFGKFLVISKILSFKSRRNFSVKKLRTFS